MKVYTKINSRNNLPDYEQLIFVMWQDGITYSRVGDESEFKKCNYFECYWNKTIDDPRWRDVSKHKIEYISFEIPQNVDNYKDSISIEIDRNALIVDKRAFYRGINLIIDKADGLYSVDGIEWIKSSEFVDKYKYYLEFGFNQAVDDSFLKLKNNDITEVAINK